LRGNTLLGVLLITLFLSSLVLFSYRKPVPSNASEFVQTTQAGFPSFPINSKLKAVVNVPSKDALVSLAELFGDRSEILVNFWATWCPPCLEELPTLDYLSRQLNDNGNKNLPLLVTISVDEDFKEVPKLFKSLDYSPSLIVLSDPEGTVSLGMGTSKFPETYLISKEGTVLKKWVGPQNWLSGNVIKDISFNSLH